MTVTSSNLGTEFDQREPCCHVWVIEAPNGPSSCGVCRLCGMKKEFFNTPVEILAAYKEKSRVTAKHIIKTRAKL
jgi:hypothetical protein